MLEHWDSRAHDNFHVVWGKLEVDASCDWSSAELALAGVVINAESSSSLENQDLESHDSLCDYAGHYGGHYASRDYRGRVEGPRRPPPPPSPEAAPAVRGASSSSSLEWRERGGSQAITPQAFGDKGLNINSDGEAEEDELATGPPGQGPCYDYELHNSGRCKPCNFFGKKVGCTSGDSCTFCHLPHEEQKRARPSKVKRDRCKVIAECNGSSVSSDRCKVIPAAAREQRRNTEPGERLQEMAGRESLQGSYMRSILASRARKEDSGLVAASSSGGPAGGS